MEYQNPLNNLYSTQEVDSTKEITPIQKITDDIKVKADMRTKVPLSMIPNNITSSLSALQPDKKIKLKDYSIDLDESHAMLSSGIYTPRFESFIQGTDNQERLAQQQSTGEKLFNGTTKALASFATGVLGGTAGLVYGLEEALTDQKLSSLYDNDFSNWMNDFNTKLRYELPNYYTKEAQNMNFGQQIVGDTANFFADKFLGGLSFTASALVSEGIWAWATGGTSLATAGARLAPRLTRFASWGVNRAEDIADVLGGVAKYKSLLNSVPGQLYKAGTTSKDFAIGLGKAGDLISLGGKMARSAGNEATIEALQFKKEEEEKFYSNFADLNGREPNAEDIAQFEKDLEDRANMVFKVNTAILMPSNAIMMGSVLGMKNPFKAGLADFIDRKAFGYGLEKTAEGAFKTIERTGLQKASRFTFNYVAKPAVTEGLFEEGGQGLTTKYNSKWLEHTYDPKLSKETFDSIGAFNEAIGEQYGTKEGWVENGLGILIGIVGGSVNARSQMKQDAEELKYKEAMANTWQDKSLQQIILPSKIQTANRIKGFALEAKEEALKGNIAKSELAKKSGQLAFINGELVMGSSVSDITSKVSKAMDTLTEEQWKEAGVENVQEYKDNALAEINTLAKEWKTNKKYWQYVIGDKLVGEQNLTFGAIDGIVGNFGKNASIVEALTWQSTIGENANKIMEDVRVAVSNEVGEEHARTLDIMSSLSKKQDLDKKVIKLLQNRKNTLDRKNTLLTEKIAKLDALEITDSQKAERGRVTAELLEVQKDLDSVNREATSIANSLADNNKQGLKDFSQTTLDSNFSDTTISSDDILRLDENIEKFQATLKSLGVSNPQRAKYLNELLEEYKQAKDVFLGAQATNRIVSSKDFKLENIGSFIGGKIAKNKAMNVDSQEWLQSVLNDYSKSVTSTTAQETEQVQKATITAEKDNTKTKPKSQEQINQEKIEALEAERRQKLAEVKTQKVFRTEGTGLGKLGVAHRGTGVYYALDKPFLTGTKGETVSELNVVLPENILDITVEENKQIFGEIQKIASERFNESDKTKPFNDLISEVAVEKGYDGIISYIEPEDTTQGREFVSFKGALKENNEIDKINREYDAKINALKPKSQNPLEQYRQRLETLLKTRYKDLISVEDETKPTQEEIQTFKDGKADDELKAKLSRWKLYDASIDEDGVSVADLITWINQAETTIEASDTKTDVTESEAWTELKEDDENGTDYSVFKPELGVNQTAPATLKYDRVNQNYELTHIKPEIFVKRLGDSYTMDTKAKSIDKLKVGDSFEIRGVRVEIGKGKRLILKKTDFESLESDLNMFSIPTDTINWTFTDIYEETGIGQPMRKVPSQFVEKGESYLNNSALFNSQKGDRLTLHVKSTSDWNASKDGGTLENFEIMLRDKDGQDINVLKAFRVEKGEPINQQFFALREEAFRRWEKAGRPDKLDLDMSVEIAQVLIGSPELNIIDRKVTDIEFTKETAKTIRAKGYILNGELTLDRPLEGVNTAYIGRISKKNPGLKQPFVVIQRGVHLIAVPISVTQRLQPVDFDGIYNSTKTPQEKVIALNESIIKNNIEVDKITFEDIYDNAKMQIVKQAFENKKVFVTADIIADKNYRQENLAGNASIKIDLTNLDQVFNAGKIKIRLDETINFGSQVEVLEDYGLSVLEKGSDLADEIYSKIYMKYGDLAEEDRNMFMDVIVNGYETEKGKNVVPNIPNTEMKKGYGYNQRGFNILVEANKHVGTLTNKAKLVIGSDILIKVDQIIKRHDLVMKNLKTTKEELKSGENNTKCF